MFTRRRMLAASALILSAPRLFAEEQEPVPPNVSDRIQDLMEANDVPGLGFGYVKHGRLACIAGFGYADRETQRKVTVDTAFHLASVSKVVTGTVLMQLWEAGRFHLDDPIQPHLDFQVVNPHHPAPITFRQLFMHTSTIWDRNYSGFQVQGDPVLSLHEFLNGYLAPGGRWYQPDRCFTRDEPGTRFLYSNVAIALAGYLAERIAGQSLKSLSSRQIFHPLRMSPAAWTLADLGKVALATPYDGENGKLIPLSPIGYPDWPAGLLRASTRAMTSFLGAYANHGLWNGKRILGDKTIGTMIASSSPPPLPEGHIRAQGLFWEAFTGPNPAIMGKSGGDPGAHNFIAFDPTSSSGVVLLTNRSSSEALTRGMLKLIDAVLG